MNKILRILEGWLQIMIYHTWAICLREKYNKDTNIADN